MYEDKAREDINTGQIERASPNLLTVVPGKGRLSATRSSHEVDDTSRDDIHRGSVKEGCSGLGSGLNGVVL